MATRLFTRSLLTTKRSLLAVLSRSYTSPSLSTPPSYLSSSSFLRFRPLVAVAGHFHRNSLAASTIRGYATRQTSSSLNDPNPNWSNRPPKETILLDGCDFEHWLVVVEPPDPEMTRDQIIDSYVKILATVVGSEEEARMKLYSVSTKHYFAFGALVSEEDSYKLKELPKVRWVLPDSYLDVKNKDYGGEPVINGQPVPYDPKYHAEWVRNNARANERNRRNDRPRNYDRSRNFERRRENMQNRGFQNQGGQNLAPNMGPMSQQGPPPPNMGGPISQQGPPPPNMGGPISQQGPPPPNMGAPISQQGPPPPNMGGQMPQQGPPPPNMGGPMPPQGPPPPNMGGQPNWGVFPPNNMESQTHMGGMPPNNMGRMPPNNMGAQPNMGPAQYTNAPPSMQQPNNMVQNNMGRVPPSNIGGGFGSNNRGVPGDAPNYQYSNGPSMGGPQFQNREIHGPQQNREYQQNYAANPSGGNPYQSGNITGRDMPQNPNYQ